MATYVTPTIVAKEALLVLEDNVVLAGLVHRDYSKEYQKIGSTVVVRKPTSFTASAVTAGTSMHMNTVTESSVTVVLNSHLDVSWEVSSQELSLNVADFSEQFIQPAMIAHAATVDSLLADLYRDAYVHQTVSSTPAITDLADLEGIMSHVKVPLNDRRLVLAPITKSGYMGVASIINANKSGDGGRALRNAEIGRLLGFDTYMDQRIRTHTQPIADAAGALGNAWSAAATSGSVISITASGTILADDVFKVTGYDEWFVVAKNATADSGGSVLVAFDPASVGTFAAASVITFQKSHRANMAFHKDAYALVTAPLAPPLGGVEAAVLNYKNISCRVVYGYTQTIKTNVMSIDQLVGVKTLQAALAARLVDAR